MASQLLGLLLGVLLVNVAFGRTVSLSTRGFLDNFINQNNTSSGSNPVESFVKVPQQMMQSGVQVAQEIASQGIAAGQQAAHMAESAAAQGVAAGQQAAQMGAGIFAAVINAAVNAAMGFFNMFSGLIPGFSPQRGSGNPAGSQSFPFRQ